MLKKLASYPSGYLYFIFARVVGLSVKPLFLMYLLSHSFKVESAMLSEIFLFLSGVFVLFAAPVHFEYYKQFFESKKTFMKIRKVFIFYISNLLVHMSIVLPMVFFLSLFISNDIVFSILLAGLLLIEKSFDEIQRFLQFSKDFISWSNIFLLKNLLPVLGVILYIEYITNEYSIYLYMILSMLSGVVIFVKYIPIFVKKQILIEIKLFNLSRFKKYIILFKKQYLSKYIQGISRANILNIDKWIALWLYSKSLLSELMLVGQFGNIINIGTNYATVSHRRSELLHSKNTISTLMMGHRVPLVAFTLLLFVMVVLFGFDILTKKGISELSNIHIVAIGIAYMLFSVTQLLTEYLFWNVDMKKVLVIDFIYYFIVVIGGIYLYYIDSYTFISLFFLVGNLFRFSAQFIYILSLNKYQKNV